MFNFFYCKKQNMIVTGTLSKNIRFKEAIEVVNKLTFKLKRQIVSSTTRTHYTTFISTQIKYYNFNKLIFILFFYR